MATYKNPGQIPIAYANGLSFLMSTYGLDEEIARSLMKDLNFTEGNSETTRTLDEFMEDLREFFTTNSYSSIDDYRQDLADRAAAKTAETKEQEQKLSEVADDTTAKQIAEQISTSEQGQATNAEDAQAKAKAARLSAASAGVGEIRSGLLGSSTQQTDNVNNYAQANRNLQQSTQNDYLSKMGQAEAMDMQAKNMRKGAVLNTISGGLQGGATGAMAGLVVSDETQKEAPSNNLDEDKLQEQINQFRTLYKRVRELRSKK